MVGGLVGWFVDCIVGVLVGLLGSWCLGYMFVCLVNWLLPCLVGGQLVDFLVGC